jgi:hypothetical protein
VTTASESAVSTRPAGAASRSCVACRKTARPDALLRIARAPDGRIVPDWRRTLGGRGAHVCPTRGCIAAAIAGRAMERAFKAPVVYPDVEEFVASVRESLSRRLGALLGSAIGGRKAVAGTDAVDRVLALGHAVCVLVASDAGDRSEIERRAASRGVPTRVLVDKAALGGMLGKRPTAVVAISDRGLAEAVSKTLERLQALQ